MANQSPSPLHQSLNNPEEFTLTYELVPGRGGRTSETRRILALVEKIAADGRIQAVSITENAGGHPALSPEVLGREIKDMGLEVIIHFSCKDKNRNQMESLLFSWDRQELDNLLVIAGDYPKEGYQGRAKPVFDLDTVQALALITAMNQGSQEAVPHQPRTISPTSFVKGVAVSPFKTLESEQMMQYFKLHRKIAAGADFVITQVGFEARKFHELLLYMQQAELTVPVLGNVFIPSLRVADLMHQGKIPGCMIPDQLHAQIKQEAIAPDKGKKARLERGAKLLAVIRGMGYAGAHIGGPALNFADLDFLLTRAEAMTPQWPELVKDFSHATPGSFYLFAKDEKSGLNHKKPLPPMTGKPPSIPFRLSRLFHDLAFAENGPLCGPMRDLCLGLHEKGHTELLSRLEHLLKRLFYTCQNCGDCTLADLAFLCPQSGCAKYLLNGPCGGSHNGWCEVYPGRKPCFYVLLYQRLKALGREQQLTRGYLPPRDWSLQNTSSWLNYFLGRGRANKNKM